MKLWIRSIICAWFESNSRVLPSGSGAAWFAEQCVANSSMSLCIKGCGSGAATVLLCIKVGGIGDLASLIIGDLASLIIGIGVTDTIGWVTLVNHVETKSRDSSHRCLGRRMAAHSCGASLRARFGGGIGKSICRFVFFAASPDCSGKNEEKLTCNTLDAERCLMSGDVS